MKNPRLILPTAAFCLLVPSLQAAMLMQTNFDSLETGAVTAADLNAVTTDGTWALNTGRNSSTYRITDFENSGDRAMEADATGSQNGGVIEFATVTLASVADFSTDAVTWNFNTGTRRTGANKGLRYEFSNSATATTVATLDWVDGGGLTLTGTDVDTGNSAFQFLFSWIGADGRDAHEFSFEFSNTGLNLTITDFGLGATGGTSTAVPNDPLENAFLSVALGSTSIDTLTVSSIGSETAAKGVHLDDMLVTQVPEPSAVLLGGIGALMLLRRRRDA